MTTQIGRRYKVSEGAGLDSRRVGTVMNPRQFSQDEIKCNEPGRYKPFDSTREAILLDDQGRMFTMFHAYLIPDDVIERESVPQYEFYDPIDTE